MKLPAEKTGRTHVCCSTSNGPQMTPSAFLISSGIILEEVLYPPGEINDN